ncbi:MAG: methyl-accepting chemotaxis protein [Noviherbaspirillum sp.]
MKFADTKVGTRLAAGFSIVLVLLALIVGIAYWRLQHVSNIVATMMSEVLAKERLANEWAANTNANGARTIIVAESLDPVRQKQVQATIKETSNRITEIQKSLEKFERSPEESSFFGQIAEKRKTYIAARDAVFKEKAVNEENARQLIRSQLEPALNDYVAMIAKMAAYQVATTAKMAEEITQLAHASQRMLAILGGLAALLGIVVAFIISASIRKQLGGEPAYAVEVANRIAAGELSNAIASRGDDRGSLLHAMKAMQDSLVQIVGEVRASTDTIATASNQIASGNLDLSSRTEHQASSLEETASSMEELTSTVKQNADNARQANSLALSASEVAVRGGTVVSEVVETMGSINDSSKKIVDIIGVIDGIAFQTNILALNAAVEAARAGEQGRGFAVVASEVRNLAQRSAAAAKEIKVLIDASVEKVDTGSKLVDQAGATMHEIVESVKRVTDIMGEITAATKEQTSGIEQINQAISQMDEVTQQNAALVEEAAAASQAMQDQADKLAQAVSVFKLDGAHLFAVVKTVKPAHGSVAAPLARKEQPARDNNMRSRRIVNAVGSSDEWEQF